MLAVGLLTLPRRWKNRDGHFHLMSFFLRLRGKFNLTTIQSLYFYFWNHRGGLVHLTGALFQTFEPSTVQRLHWALGLQGGS